MAKTLLPISELTRSTTIGSVIVTGADLVPTYLSGTIGQILKVQPDGQLLFENESTSSSVSTDPNNDITNTSGLFLDVSQTNITDTNNLVTGSTGGTTQVTLQTLIDNLSEGGTGVAQTLSISGNDLTISGGNTITLPISTGGSGISSIVAGTNITIDNTDPDNPIISSSGGGTTLTTTSELTNNGSDGTSTYVENDELSIVATTGNYSDLVGLPTISDNQDASEVPFTPIGNTASTDVQSAIEELQTEINSLSTAPILPNPTQVSTTIQNVNGSFTEVAETRIRFEGSDLSLNDGDNSRVLTLPTDILLESNGFIVDVVVSGQPRFLTDDYLMVSSNQIRFEFPLFDDEVIHITYKIELNNQAAGLPTPTTAASILQNVNGSFTEVLEKRERFLGSDLSLNDGDNNRVLLLPDSDVLLETNGFIVDIVVSGQPRFLTDDYIFTSSNQVQFTFPLFNSEIIHITYKIEA